MRSNTLVASYRRLREGPIWRLLAAAKSPEILGILQAHLFEATQSIPQSVLYERIERDLEDLRAEGVDLPQTAQEYVSGWLRDGYIERYFPTDAVEEVYELSVAAESAIRFINGLVDRRTTATESRLSVVIEQLVRLAEQTDTNPTSRIAALEAEKAKIDQELASINRGELMTLDDKRALERTREIIGLSDDLVSDFRRVRGEFERLNKELRSRIIDEDDCRGAVLEALFAGVDLISESDAGRTFSAFWRLLTDPEQSAILDEALEQVLSRDFSRKLTANERQYLRRVTRILLNQGGTVHDVLQQFARSLKHFVQSREYLEQRRLTKLLAEAQRASIDLKEQIKVTDRLDYVLTLSSCKLTSVAQWRMYDPTYGTADGAIGAAEPASIDLESISDLVAQSEIDFASLKANIRHLLKTRDQVSIGNVISEFPATQGLGSVVGYVALGCRHGVLTQAKEVIEWQGSDNHYRTAQIPFVFFLKERLNDLA